MNSNLDLVDTGDTHTHTYFADAFDPLFLTGEWRMLLLAIQ